MATHLNGQSQSGQLLGIKENHSFYFVTYGQTPLDTYRLDHLLSGLGLDFTWTLCEIVKCYLESEFQSGHVNIWITGPKSLSILG